jgi:multidrug efflux pump subunit AcrA (membrane-fusion protein)
MSDDILRLPPAPERRLLPPPQSRIRAHPWLIGLIALAALLIIFFVGYLPRHRRDEEVKASADREASSLPSANVMQVHPSTPISNLLLPGDITPLTEAYIFARATGYVRHRYADIGDHVREGQILADIDAPDLDAQVAQGRAALAQAEQQLGQAKASLENAQAQEDLAKVTWDRYKVLVTHGAVSRQDADTQEANYKTSVANVHLQEAGVRNAEENVRAARANLDRLIALQDFEHVRAPFAGVVTARNFDIGAYINGNGAASTASSTPMGGTQSAGQLGNAGASGSPATQATSPSSPTSTGAPPAGSSGELFRVAQIDRVRVLINVPQENAPTVHAGQQASVLVMEFAGRKFAGTVTRTSMSLGEATRTLLTEVQVPNPTYQLLPGMYAQVQFSDRRSSPPLLVPGDSVVATADGLQVAVIQDLTPEDRQQLQERLQPKKKESGKDAEQQRQKTEQEIQQARKIAIRNVQVGRDYGTETEVTAGLQPGEIVVVNPGDEIRAGAIIVPKQAPPIQGQGGQQNQMEMQGQAGGIGSPSMAAPTLSSQQKQGQKGGKSTGKNGKNTKDDKGDKGDKK